MSKQYNKILKRRRRKAYIKRKKKLAKLATKAKEQAASQTQATQPAGDTSKSA